jgi:hypothetical protein
MELIGHLWLPILLSSVFVFIVSSIVHMVLPIHKGDYKRLPGEDKITAEMRAQGVTAGSYMVPYPAECKSMKDFQTPEMIEKYKQGPVGQVILIPNGSPAMGKSLVLWFLFSVVVSGFAAYLGYLALGWGAPYRAVFRVTGTAAILGYAVSSLPDSIWRGQRWGITLKFVIDGIVYGLVTAGTFGWLGPEAM